MTDDKGGDHFFRNSHHNELHDIDLDETIENKGTTETVGSNESPANRKDSFKDSDTAPDPEESAPEGPTAGIDDEDYDGTKEDMDPVAINRRITKVGLLIALCVLLLVAGAITLGVLAKKISGNNGTGNGGGLFGVGGGNSNVEDTLPPEPSQSPSDFPSLEPSEVPSEVPSSSPSEMPSLTPTTSEPSSIPSDQPSESPSSMPSASPSTSPPTWEPSSSPSSSPTDTPSQSPTESWIPPNPVPRNPPRGYFNYDINDRSYGPDRWHRVDTSRHPLREFTDDDGWGPYQGHLQSKDPLENRCDGPDRRQSPKDLRDTIGCEAHHEIRTRCGSSGLRHNDYERLILPHKLCLVMNRRRCLDVESSACDERRPPIADYPRYSSGLTPYSDLLNLDIKVPAEHTMEGEEFDAEIQMLHTHLDPNPARVSSIGILIRARRNGFNFEFQQLLDLFQAVYNDHADTCRRKRKERQLRRRHMDGDEDNNSNATTSSFPETEHEEDVEEVTYDDDVDDEQYYSHPNSTLFGQQQRQRQREIQSSRVPQDVKFDPYSEAFMPSIFFYRYDGSITEPPCMDITWWVMMDPMTISLDQLQQIKHLLFTHVDEDCEPTSVHNEDQSVARPIYPLGDDREIQKCGPGTFESDEDKGRGPGNICRR